MDFFFIYMPYYILYFGACRLALYCIGIVSQKFINFLQYTSIAINTIMMVHLVSWIASEVPQGGNFYDINGYPVFIFLIVAIYIAPFAFFGMLLTKYRLTEIDDLNKKLYFEEKIKENNIYDIIYNSDYHVYFFNEKQIDRAIKRIAKQNKR